MSGPKYDVFISYRRDGGEAFCTLLHDRLTAMGYRVFQDVESLNPGPFNTQLLEVIEQCTDFIVVCSKGSMERCKNEGDWVRREIAHALEHKKNIIPVILRDFKWSDHPLPADIAPFADMAGIEATSNELFPAAIERLAKKFMKSTNWKEVAEKKRRRVVIGIVAGVVVVVVAAVGLFVWPKWIDKVKGPAWLAADGVDLYKPYVRNSHSFDLESWDDLPAVRAITPDDMQIVHTPIGKEDHYIFEAKATQGNRIFQRGEHLYVLAYDNGIYKMKVNGDDLHWAVKGQVSDFVIYDNFMYFMNESRAGFIRLNMDTDESDMFLTGDWSHFSPLVSEAGLLFTPTSFFSDYYSDAPVCHAVDFSGNTVWSGVVKDGVEGSVILSGGRVFYTMRNRKTGAYELFSQNFDGTDVMQIGKSLDLNIGGIIEYDGEYLYVASYDDRSVDNEPQAIYQLDIISNEYKKCESFTPARDLHSHVQWVIPKDGYIYNLNGNGIIRTKTSDNSKEKLLSSNMSIVTFDIFGKWIFLWIYDSSEEGQEDDYICRMTLDGKTFEVIAQLDF